MSGVVVVAEFMMPAAWLLACERTVRWTCLSHTRNEQQLESLLSGPSLNLLERHLLHAGGY